MKRVKPWKRRKKREIVSDIRAAREQATFWRGLYPPDGMPKKNQRTLMRKLEKAVEGRFNAWWCQVEVLLDELTLKSGKKKRKHSE